jgi:hypothetical protein
MVAEAVTTHICGDAHERDQPMARRQVRFCLSLFVTMAATQSQAQTTARRAENTHQHMQMRPGIGIICSIQAPNAFFWSCRQFMQLSTI